MGQIAARALDRQAGVRTTYHPCADTVAAAKAVLAGQAGAFWGYSTPVSIADNPGAKFRALAVASRDRLPSLPDVPTFRESGMDLIQDASVTLAVPAQTPEITLEEISEYFSNQTQSPGFTELLTSLGFVPAHEDMKELTFFITEMRKYADRQAEAYELHNQ
jgi:tripartite-type tricarboxylate transporter receptor subunit TctC